MRSLRPSALQWLAVLAIVVGLAAQPTAADASGPAPTNDAQFFAQMLGVDVNEASRRLWLQRVAGDLDARLAAQESATFAGLWLEQTPKFKVVAAFTRDGVSTLRRYVAGTPLASVAEARTALESVGSLRAQLRSILWLANDGIANLGTSVQDNTINVRVVSRSALDAALAAKNVQLPATAAVTLVPALPRPAANIYGGLPLDGGSACTSGFGIVQNSTGTRGVTTAGHCANSLTYSGSSLTFQYELVGGVHDEQWHVATGFQVQNWVTDSFGTRQITSRTPSSNTPIGALACKYGRSTGFGCGYITEKDNTGCITNGSAGFIYVQSQGIDLVNGGDSGGPVYVDNSAYGMISCEAPAGGINMIYTAVENFEFGMGVSVLTAP